MKNAKPKSQKQSFKEECLEDLRWAVNAIGLILALLVKSRGVVLVTVVAAVALGIK